MMNRSRLFSSISSKQYAIRISLLGEAEAGKTSLLNRIKFKTFRDPNDDPTSSVGASRGRSYDAHTLTIRPNRGTKINLTVVDTAGRERYQSLTAQYYRGSNVILLVCGLDSEHTLTRLAKWHQEALFYIDETEVIFALVATKSDLQESERDLSREMLEAFADNYNISREYLFEVSARTGKGVDNMLNKLCMAVINRYEASPGAKLCVRRPGETSNLLDHEYCSERTDSVTTSMTSNYSLNDTMEFSSARCLCCVPTRRKCVIL